MNSFTKIKQMKKVLVFLAEGFEEIEAITPIDVLRRAGVEVITVSITGNLYVEAAHGVIIKADTSIDKVSFDDVAMLLLPGGMPGASNLDNCDFLKEKIVVFYKQGKYIAAICAAPLVLGGLELLKGKNVTCYPGYEQNLIGANPKGTSIEIDGNIITAKGVGAAMEFALTLVSILVDEKTAREHATKMVVENYL